MTCAYFAAFVSLGLASASLGPTLPGLAALTASSVAQISTLFIARSLGYLVGSALGGRLYDRAAGHPVMAASLVAMAGAMGLIPLASVLWLLFLAVLLLGLVEGIVDVGGNTFLVWLHRQGVGPYMNALHFTFGLGAFLSPVIIAQLALQGGGLRLAYWTLAVLLLPAALWLVRLPSPSAPTRTASDPAERGAGRALALTVAFFFLYVGAEIGFGGWIYSYAVGLRLASQVAAAYLTSAFWGAFTAGRLLGIPLAVRYPPQAILLADLAGALASLGLLLAAPGSALVAWIGACGVGLCMASTFPAMLALAQRRLRITGRVTGWFLIGGSAGGMTLPWVIGQFFGVRRTAGRHADPAPRPRPGYRDSRPARRRGRSAAAFATPPDPTGGAPVTRPSPQLPGFRIRFAEAADAPLILQFIRGLAEYEKLSHEMHATEAQLRETLFGPRRYAEVILGELEGRPVGFALFFHNYSTFLGQPGIYLEDLFVQPEMRGRGFGKALLTFLAALAVERKCGRLEWSVLDWNAPAIGFYQKLGAVPMDAWTIFRLTGDALTRLGAQAGGA